MVAALLALLCLLTLSAVNTRAGAPVYTAGHDPASVAPLAPASIDVPFGPNWLVLDTARDYVINLPDGEMLGPLVIDGGRNVTISGGHIVMDDPDDTLPDSERRGLYIKDSWGTVSLDRILIEGRHGTAFDAITIAAPRARIELTNFRVENVSGVYDGFHGDIVQIFGGVRSLSVDGLTGISGYQGFYLEETDGGIGEVSLRNVNLRYLPNDENHTTYLLWLNGCKSYPVSLANVYIEPRPYQELAGHSIWPNDFDPRECPAIEVAVRDGRTIQRFAYWPLIPNVHGVVLGGDPPGGDYVTRAQLGVPPVSYARQPFVPAMRLRSR